MTNKNDDSVTQSVSKRCQVYLMNNIKRKYYFC